MPRLIGGLPGGSVATKCDTVSYVTAFEQNTVWHSPIFVDTLHNIVVIEVVCIDKEKMSSSNVLMLV